MAHDVFISYAHGDRTVANAVVATLESRGIRCWIAPRDIIPGEDWGAAIIDAINDARAMVLVFSSHSNESDQIKREVERTVHQGIAVIPFRIEDVLPSKTLEYFISTQHWLDALTPPLEDHLEHLAETITVLLAKKRGKEILRPVGGEEPAAPRPETAGPRGNETTVSAQADIAERGVTRKFAWTDTIKIGLVLLLIVSGGWLYLRSYHPATPKQPVAKPAVPEETATKPTEPPEQPVPTRIKVTTDSGEAYGSKVGNIVQGHIFPSRPGPVTFNPATMWHSDASPTGWVSVQITFPTQVELTRVGIHSQHSGKYHAARAVRISVQTEKGDFSRVIEQPLSSIDELVSLPATKGQTWKFEFKAGETWMVVLRGLQFYSGEKEIFPAVVASKS